MLFIAGVNKRRRRLSDCKKYVVCLTTATTWLYILSIRQGINQLRLFQAAPLSTPPDPLPNTIDDILLVRGIDKMPRGLLIDLITAFTEEVCCWSLAGLLERWRWCNIVTSARIVRSGITGIVAGG